MTMLEQLLGKIRQGGTLDMYKLADQLNTSPQMVEAMLDHLHRSGLLRPYDSCDDSCDGCGLKQSCSSKIRNATLRLWQYTQDL